ncbi:MAG: NAD+ synthase [Planctomycetes bacterium]|nr:NAD+ synthase [Planctomycetota bacterium]
MSAPRIDVRRTEVVLTAFLRQEARKFGFSSAVVGLSGGIDSAVSAALAARAYGPENTLAVLMPYRTSAKESAEHAQLLVDQLGIRSETFEITSSVESLLGTIPAEHRVRRGNLMARTRMIVLYDRSARDESLVVGTSNKTEILLGYSTQYGDAACAINPVGDLYKTQIFQLAEHLGIPEPIRHKAPSADLWEGQTDEGELGFTYEQVDGLLHLLVDRRHTRAEVLAAGHDPTFVDRVMALVRRNQYKRRPPIVAKLGNRTVNIDFRYVRDWGGLPRGGR